MTAELYDPKRQYAAPAGAHLSYNNGPLMSHVKIVGVFIDELDGSPYALTSDMDAFLAWIVSSDRLGMLSEYDVSGYQEGSGSYEGKFALSLGQSTPPPPPPPSDCTAELDAFLNCLGYASARPLRVRLLDAAKKHQASTETLTDAEVQSLLSSAITAGSVPAPDDNTLYCLFFPTGVSITVGTDASCQTFCGYHDNFASGSAKIRYAVLPFPDCQGCLGGLSAKDSLTSITTHEIAEAVNDPEPGSGWYDQTNGEIGDICAWQTAQDGGHTVQLLWSNKQNTCI